MDGENLFSGSWYEYVHHKVRSTYLSVLGILSEKRVPCLLVGSASLLAHGYYKKEYWWDIDILFPDVETLEEFRRDAAAKQQFAIEDVDDEVQTTPELYSFHTLWSHKGRSHRPGGWVNVDLIVRRDFNWYKFHRRVIERYGTFSHEIVWDGEVYSLDLYMAHPWGIFVEKIFSPRVMKELVFSNNYSYDARDIFTILEKDGENPDFVNYMAEILTTKNVNSREFRKRIVQILRRKDWLGYGYVPIPVELLNSIHDD